MQSMVAVVAKSEKEKSYGEREKKMLHLADNVCTLQRYTHSAFSARTILRSRNTV